MYSSTFIFKPGEFDDTFHRLDRQIAEAARATPGYLGEESWESAATGLICNVYYWQSLQALQSLVSNAQHREAKQQQAHWLQGYRVIIGEVVRMYGDGKLDALLPTLPATSLPSAGAPPAVDES